MATPLGYVDSAGWANSLNDSLANLVEKPAQITFRKNTPICERPSAIEILNCMDLVRVSRVSKFSCRFQTRWRSWCIALRLATLCVFVSSKGHKRFGAQANYLHFCRRPSLT